MNLRKISYKSLNSNILLLLFICLVFLYDYFIDFLSFLDELIAVLFIISILFVKKIKLLGIEYAIFILLVIIFLLGLLSNTMTQRKIMLSIIALDALSFYKAFIAYFGVRIIFKEITFEFIYPGLKKIAIWGFLILGAFIIYDLIFYLFPRTFRFGFFSLELFFNHPSRLSFAFSFLFILLYPYYIDKRKAFLVLILLIGLVTLRVKYIGFLLIAMIFIFNKNFIFKVKKQYLYTFLAIAPIVLFFVFKEWIMFYFSDEAVKLGWSRAILLRHSVLIAGDYFPLGTGFGSFASFFSGQEYSWVYRHYRIDYVWGMSKTHHHFLADQYWPMVLGQFGVFGLLAMLGVVFSFIKLLLSYFKSTQEVFLKNAIIAGLLGLILLLIDSTSDAIISQNRGVAIFIFIALIINDCTKVKTKNIN